MIAFINEQSLEQFCDLCESLTFFFRASRELAASGVPMRKNSGFFQSAGFQTRFNHVSIPHDLKAELRQLAFGSRFATCWREQRRSAENEVYFCSDLGVTLSD